MSGAMGSHHRGHHGLSDRWLTPPEITKALGVLDLDPCADFDGAYLHAVDNYTEGGLDRPWEGMVWLNPPYSEVWTWLERLADHGSGVALIFARTETAGFVREVWGKADSLLFLHGRLHFHHPDGTRAPANSGAPSVLVGYGAEATQRLRECGLPGSLVVGWKPTA